MKVTSLEEADFRNDFLDAVRSVETFWGPARRDVDVALEDMRDPPKFEVLLRQFKRHAEEIRKPPRGAHANNLAAPAGNNQAAPVGNKPEDKDHDKPAGNFVRKRRCPGCKGMHAMKPSTWWENCWTFHKLYNKNPPEGWEARDNHKRNIDEWFKNNPELGRRTKAWMPKKPALSKEGSKEPEAHVVQGQGPMPEYRSPARLMPFVK